MDTKGLVKVEDRALALQELETRFAMAVKQRELLAEYIRDRLKPDKHYYKFVDDPKQKPSLTKEGAELICLPHNLKPKYRVLSGPDHPPADNSPYQITVNCGLFRGDISEGEGIGSASSYITKKDGTFKPRQNDPGLCHNATVKMACKSAYIAACLNATAASEFFTQDMEDTETSEESTEKPKQSIPKEHWCSEHKTAFFKKGKMRFYAHPIGNTGKWCNEDKPKKAQVAEPEEEKVDTSAEQTEDSTLSQLIKIDLRLGINRLAEGKIWSDKDVRTQLEYYGGRGDDPEEMLESLPQDMARLLLNKVNEDLAGLQGKLEAKKGG